MKRLRAILSVFGSLYIPARLFMMFGVVVILFLFSFPFHFLFPVTQAALAIGVMLVVGDVFLLYNVRFSFVATRTVGHILSLGDENPVRISLENKSPIGFSVVVIDELPYQLQERTFRVALQLNSSEKRSVEYQIRPVIRGEYLFGKINLFARSFLGLIERRLAVAADESIAVYPSVIQMRKFELKTFTRIATQTGIKRNRRLGHSYEFEQIKTYVRGDDYRSINWKATGRTGGDLMVNQYEDEKAQQVYCIIDKSRAMRMPFDGLSLLDHSINTGLVIANIALRKHDKAGLLTFSDKIGTLVKADRGPRQLQHIMDALYKQRDRNLEANYELLYSGVSHMIKGRSLLFLFTNFESPYAMERVIKLLRSINRTHLLVVIIFENTELLGLSQAPVANVEGIYLQTIAQKLVTDKQQIVQELNKYGIQTILTKPNELSMNVINKYLELKSRGLI